MLGWIQLSNELLARAVNALEAIAIHQKRVADMMEQQSNAHKKLELSFQTLLGNVDGGSESESVIAPKNPEEDSDPLLPKGTWNGDPHNWFIENHDTKEARILLRLNDGTTREPTEAERRRLK